MILKLANGYELKLKKVSQAILQTLLADLTAIVGDDPTINPDAMENMPPEKQAKALQLTNRLIQYCAGWGIENDPPETSELATLLGYGNDKPSLRRATWVLHDLCQGGDEQSSIMAAVMSYSFSDSDSDDELVSTKELPISQTK